MREKHWFKEKNFGWGWYPSSWEGFVVTILFIVLIAFIPNYLAETFSSTPKEYGFNFAATTGILIMLLIWICAKTGEKLSWRWVK